MKIKVEDLDVYFPFEIIYKEQFEYMTHLKQIIDNRGHGLIEMPTGTGKTVSLFALALAYKLKHPKRLEKIVYCTRTISQLEKAVEELRAVEKTIASYGFKPATSSVISARRTLCINENVKVPKASRDQIDAGCRVLTKFPDSEGCRFYDNFKENFEQTEPAKNTLNIEDILAFGHEHQMCPYYSSRALVKTSDIIICNYPYILDDRVSSVIFKNINNNSLIMIDEAHNIDDVCVDSKTIKIDSHTIHEAYINISDLEASTDRVKNNHFEVFQKEYNNLSNKIDKANYTSGLGPITDKEKFKQIPGNLRKAEHFFKFLRRFLAFLNNYMKMKEVVIVDPQTFVNQLKIAAHIEENMLMYAGMRLQHLIETLQYTAIDQLNPISWVIQLGEFLVNFKDGFKVIFEPHYDNGKAIIPVLQCVCLDSSIAMNKLLKQSDSVVLTSGTLSPMNMYAQILGMIPFKAVSVKPNFLRNSIHPIIVSKATDQSPLTSEFVQRGNTLVTRNYGELLCQLARWVPDGIVTFFPSYEYMHEMLLEWKYLGILENLIKYKLLFVETKNQDETSIALQNYKKACERGRGGVFACVARGKVAEGVDFKNYLGRCALIIGIPFQYSRSRALMCRTEFLHKKYKITQKSFIIFNAIKQTAQCLGRVIRGKMDYGMMILADRRFNDEKLTALPEWIQHFLRPENTDLQMDIAIALVKKFFMNMAKKPIVDKEIYLKESDFN